MGFIITVWAYGPRIGNNDKFPWEIEQFRFMGQTTGHNYDSLETKQEQVLLQIYTIDNVGIVFVPRSSVDC